MANSPTLPDPPRAFNLAHYLFHHHPKDATKIALVIAGHAPVQEFRFDQLEQMVLGTARGLQELPLKAGARILLRLGNTHHFPIAYLGAIAGGFVPVVSSSMLTASETTRVAQVTRPSAVLAAPGISVPDSVAGPVISLAELEGYFGLPPTDYVMGAPDRPGYVVMTSGTQAQPRAVLHAHRAIWARQMMWQDWEGLGQHDRMMHAGAFNWTYTLGTGVLDPWAIGACAIVPSAGVEVPDLPALAKAARASIFAAAPGVFRKLLRGPLDFGPDLRHALSAGEKLPQSTRENWMAKTGTQIHEAFGMSECSTFLSGSPERGPVGSALGWPQRGRRLALYAQGARVAPGEIGEIAIHQSDPGLMLGYLGDEAGTAERFHDGHFLTGDLAREEDNGAFSYIGRADDMLNAGGFRVSPAEVEAAMALMEGIEDCAAIDVQLAEDTTIIALYYTGQKQPEDALQAHAARHLARYKQPRAFYHLADLPRGPNNKMSRRRLRQMTGHEMDGT